MHRRGFIKGLGLGLAAVWVWGPWGWTRPSIAAASGLSLGLLADAHIKDGDDRRPEAKALARAVDEIRALTPSPDLVLLAGDLAHAGRAEALDLGKEILADLPAPVWAVRGEGDCNRHGSEPWERRFGKLRFSRTFQGVHLIGLDTTLAATPQGPVFEIGAPQRRWLAKELAEIDPSEPLVVISHAPLARLFQPWQQWTADAGEVAAQFSRFRRVLCLHGHVHGIGLCDQGSGARNVDQGDNIFLTENPLLSLPATAWPQPQAVQGTPAVVRPGHGPGGCGWSLLTLTPAGTRFLPRVWQA